jgi:hypothetical protein
MSTAFQITSDDIQNVCADHFNKNIDWETAEDILDMISLESAEKEALRGDTLDEQTEYAYQHIKLEMERAPEVQSLLKHV